MSYENDGKKKIKTTEEKNEMIYLLEKQKSNG
jgi:hypothetical protein